MSSVKKLWNYPECWLFPPVSAFRLLSQISNKNKQFRSGGVMKSVSRWGVGGRSGGGTPLIVTIQLLFSLFIFQFLLHFNEGRQEKEVGSFRNSTIKYKKKSGGVGLCRFVFHCRISLSVSLPPLYPPSCVKGVFCILVPGPLHHPIRSVALGCVCGGSIAQT